MAAALSTWSLAESLNELTVRDAVESWPAFAERSALTIGPEGVTLLEALGLATPPRLTLTTLVDITIGAAKRVEPAVAAMLGGLITVQSVQRGLLAERDNLFKLLGDAQFLAEDGSWQQIRQLSFIGIDDAAGFVAPSHRLSSAYNEHAIAFAGVARSEAGYSPNARNLAVWVRDAVDEDRRRAFLRFLLAAPEKLARETFGQGIPWLPALAALSESPILSLLTAIEKQTLLWRLGAYDRTFTPFLDSAEPDPPRPEAVLAGIHGWWDDNRELLVEAYEESVYPEGFDFTRLEDEDDEEAWFALFALAAFHTIGRTQPQQGKAFVQHALVAGWWSELARYARTEDAGPWIARLKDWSEPDVDERFLMWKRYLVDLHTIARYLPDYIRLMRTFSRIIAKDGPVSLRLLLQPQISQIASRMGIVAPPIARSLGIGGNWLVRELFRNGVFKTHSEGVVPYGWSASGRVRLFLKRIGLPKTGRGIEASPGIHALMVEHIGPDRARFAGDLDLPLQLITLDRYADHRRTILNNAGSTLLTDDMLEIDADD